MPRKLSYIALLLLILVSFSCKKIKQLPPEPKIEYRSYVMFDSTDILLGNTFKAGRLEFYFEDGDGDLGLDQPIPGYPDQDTVNLVFYQYNKANGIYSEPDDTLHYRIPYIERLGQNQVLMGTITISFLYIGFSDQDTIKYDFFIKDRAGNISNTSTSCEISFFDEGGCIEDPA